MKDNDKNSEYGLNYFETFCFCFCIYLPETEAIAFGFIGVNQRLRHWSMITKNCANKQSDLIITFYDLKINLFLSGVHTGWRALYKRRDK
jgi:hypothetical protein